MQFIITAHDGEGMLAKRMEVRPQHLENMGKIKGKVLCAGGLLDEEGKMKGSWCSSSRTAQALTSISRVNRISGRRSGKRSRSRP